MVNVIKKLSKYYKEIEIIQMFEEIFENLNNENYISTNRGLFYDCLRYLENQNLLDKLSKTNNKKIMEMISSNIYITTDTINYIFYYNKNIENMKCKFNNKNYIYNYISFNQNTSKKILKEMILNNKFNENIQTLIGNKNLDEELFLLIFEKYKDKISQIRDILGNLYTPQYIITEIAKILNEYDIDILFNILEHPNTSDETIDYLVNKFTSLIEKYKEFKEEVLKDEFICYQNWSSYTHEWGHLNDDFLDEFKEIGTKRIQYIKNKYLNNFIQSNQNLYLMEFGYMNKKICKIGISNNPFKRSNKIRNSNNLEMLRLESFAVKNPKKLESFFHNKYVSNRFKELKGDGYTEFFNIDFKETKEQILNIIKDKQLFVDNSIRR